MNQLGIKYNSRPDRFVYAPLLIELYSLHIDYPLYTHKSMIDTSIQLLTSFFNVYDCSDSECDRLNNL